MSLTSSRANRVFPARFAGALALVLVGVTVLVYAHDGEIAYPTKAGGRTSVDDFILACRAHEHCDNPSTTSNGEFRIEVLTIPPVSEEQANGDVHVTYTWDICKLTSDSKKGGTSALSHFTLGVDLSGCLGTNAQKLADIVEGVAVNGEPTYAWQVLDVGDGDPTTAMQGLKVDEFATFGQGECATVSITFNQSKLNPGSILTVGCVPAATKAGNQDIGAKKGSTTPGYACILGPVCAHENPNCETAWAVGTKTFIGEKIAQKWGWIVTYNGGELVTPIYAGAAKNDLSKGTNVGTLTVSHSDGTLTVTYNINITPAGRTLEDVHLWIGDSISGIPQNAAPGLFPHDSTSESASVAGNTVTFTIDMDPVLNPLYLAAHAVVCH
jgi:hypothetical protein